MTSRTNEDVAAFLARRNDILMRMDVVGMCAILKEQGQPVPTDPLVALITLHKARTGCNTLPKWARKLSKQWLLSRGYTSWDDGDL